MKRGYLKPFSCHDGEVNFLSVLYVPIHLFNDLAARGQQGDCYNKPHKSSIEAYLPYVALRSQGHRTTKISKHGKKKKHPHYLARLALPIATDRCVIEDRDHLISLDKQRAFNQCPIL